MQNQTKWPLFLFALYLIECILLAVNPVSRTTWWAENITVWIILTPLVWMYLKGIRFSNLAYTLMAVLIFFHTIGGHFTFSEVPFDFITERIGATRNHFDRMAHFTVGFYAFAIMEFVELRGLTKSRAFSWWFAVAAIFAIAGIFEIVEWLYAVGSDPVAGAEFLGSQGDIWDAQKDMLADGLGALLTATLYALLRPQPGA